MDKRDNIIVSIGLVIIFLLLVNFVVLIGVHHSVNNDREKTLRVGIIYQRNKGGEYVEIKNYNIMNFTQMEMEFVDDIYYDSENYTMLKQYFLAVDQKPIIFDFKGLNNNLTYEVEQTFSLCHQFNDTEQLTIAMMVFEGNWCCLSYFGGFDIVWILIGNEWYEER